MKHYEKEAIKKNFWIFFLLLELLLVLLFIELFHSKKRDYFQKLYKSMEVCSYTLKCPEFTIDFVPKKDHQPNHLHLDHDTPTAYFDIGASKNYFLRITYTQENYRNDIREIRWHLGIKFIVSTVLLLITALLFTLYSLRPIRQALKINDEFVKDILHDFNTPIASMVLNIKMQEEEYGETVFTKRIQTAVNTIDLLQKNLKCFLKNFPTQNDTIPIDTLLSERIAFMQSLYPNVSFIPPQYERPIVVHTSKDVLVRIIDNLLSNAAKYNRPQGTIQVICDATSIRITDTGKGIRNVQAIFDRYYKEQQRGIGLGLHIVKKLCDELGIHLHIDSVLEKGTTVTLDISAIIDKGHNK